MPVRREDLPLLFAGVEHRAWIAAVEDFLKGDRESLPLVHHQCRFFAWLDAEGLALHQEHPAFASIVSQHRLAHELAIDLCAIKATGRNTEALARVNELHGLRDTLLEQLQVLVLGNGP